MTLLFSDSPNEVLMKSTFLISAVLSVALCSVRASHAQGDYSRAIGGGYDFVRCNATETVISRSSRVVFSPLDYPEVGPIKNYCLTPEALFLQTVGRKRVSSNPKNTFEGPDRSRTFFFLIDRSSDVVAGPLDENQFLSATQQNSRTIQWQSVSQSSLMVIAAVCFACLVLLVFIVIISQRKRLHLSD